MTWRGFAGGPLAVVLLAVLGFNAGRHAFASAPTQSFYQSEFGPAVMIATGRGFVNPEPIRGGALEDFLARRTDSIDPSEVDVKAIVPADQFQVAHWYLMTAVGWWWRATTVSWSQLAAVAGFAHALAVISTFALLRLFVPAVPAVIGAVWLASSPLQLGYAPHLHDFAKGAFVLAATPFAVALATMPLAASRLALLAAAAGAVIGVGLGFKMDVAIMAPIIVLCVILFRGARPWSAIREKVIVVAVLLATSGITARPILLQLPSGGSNAAHVVLLGYSDWFDTRLGIEPASYSFVPFYSDPYLRNMVRARASDLFNRSAPMPSAEYDAAGMELWRQWVRHFPADVYTRLLAAVDGILNLGFDYPAPIVIADWWPTQRLSAVFVWLGGWLGWGWLLGVLIVFVAARNGARSALFLTTLLIAMAGYPALQYDPRHYFHLQAIPIAAIVILGWGSIAVSARRIRRVPSARPALPLKRRLLVVGLIGLGVLAPLAGLRLYQQHHLAVILNDVATEPRQRLDVDFVQQADGRFLARWPGVQGQPSAIPGLSRAYYVAEFNAEGPREVMAVGLRYSAAPDWTPCAMPRRLQTAAGVARFAFPVYSFEGETTFEGIELGAEMRRRFAGLYLLPAGPAGLPIDLHLASDWFDRRLYQRLIREERLWPDDASVGMTPGADRCGTEVRLIDAILSPAIVPGAADIAIMHSKDVEVGDHGISVDGTANDEPAYLVEFKPRVMQTGDAMVARVWLDRGSIMIALVKDGTWSRYALATKPGVSVVILRAPEPGDYSVLVTSGDPGLQPTLTFTIDRLAIVSAEAGAGTAPGNP